jgi:hypothetical protein
MGNSRKPSAPIKGQVREMKPLTPEERKEQAARAYMQKRESIATGVLFNLMHNQELLNGHATAEDVAEYAIKVADAMIEKLYFTKEEEE